MSEAQDIQARHAHYLEQFKNGLDKDFLPFFKRVVDGLRAELLKTDTVRSQKRIQQKLDFVNSLVFDAMTEYVEQTQQQLMLFADSEAEFTAGTINRLLDEGATVPTRNQVWSAVKSRPFNNTNVQTVFKNYPRDMSRLVSDAVSLGFFEGKKTSDIVRDITGTVSANYKDGTLNQVRTAASRMVRTTSAHISAVANNRTYEQNIDLVPHYEWLSVLDARTSAICQERSGEVYETGKGPLPPAHPNACLKGTLITTSKGQVPIEDVKVGDFVLTHNGNYKKVTTVMARKHDDLARDLILSNGASVSLTNEHPILTFSEGWINTGDVKTGFDVFYNTDKLSEVKLPRTSFVKQTVLIDSHNIVTEVADELISYGIFSNTRGMTSAINLNNSTANDKIRDVAVDDNLEIETNAEFFENFYKKFFVKSRFVFKRFSQTIGDFLFNAFHVDRVANLHSFARLLANFRVSFGAFFRPMIFTFWRRGVSLTSNDRISSTSCFNTELNTTLSDSIVRKSVFPFNKTKGFTFGKVFGFNKLYNLFVSKFFHNKSASDKWYNVSVTSIVEYHYQGWVYNLSVEDDETYTANGVLVHNCRSTISPLFEEDVNSKGEKTIKDDVPSYQEWLSKQSAKFQDEVLGPTKGKLFRQGGLTLDKFVNRAGQTLTLDQLKSKYPTVWDESIGD